MKKYLFLILIWLLNFNLYCLGQNGNANCTAASCHGNLIDQEVVHTAVEDGCDKCHQSNGNEHPQKGVKGFTFLAEIPQLCYKCHDENNTKSNVHDPVAKGECMACHTPHSSPKYFLLKENPSSKLCEKCHDMAMTKKRVQHDPVKIGKCYKCHDPHESDNPKFLKKKVNDLCVKCHKQFKEVLKSEDEVLHMPFADNCVSCHDPHSSEEDHLTKQSIPGLCYTCHDENNTRKNVHSPVAEGKCMECHTPHSSPKYFLLKENPSSKLCEKCHDLAMTKKRVQHEPVSIGKCYKCHDPHDSDRDSFLKKDIPKLCLKCHKKTKEQLNLKSVHSPFENNCLACHDQIHSSAEDHLLSKTSKNLCFKCHDRTIPTETGEIINMRQLFEESEFVHGAIEKNGCAGCHNPHASEHSSLLISSFPGEGYATGDKDNFALCFKCHEAGLLSTEVTTTATAFRNGDKNLHFLHVNRDKGRSCTACHNVHAAANNHLIAETVSFGNWNMPINYLLLDNGGSCKPGCHSEKKYER